MAFAWASFPSSKEPLRNGPEQSRARRFCAAERTLDGEDRSGIWGRRERRPGVPGGVPLAGFRGSAPDTLPRAFCAASRNTSPSVRFPSPTNGRRSLSRLRSRFPSTRLPFALGSAGSPAGCSLGFFRRWGAAISVSSSASRSSRNAGSTARSQSPPFGLRLRLTKPILSSGRRRWSRGPRVP